MAFLFSTGAKIRMMDSGFVSGWADGLALIFGGTPPTDPSNGTTGTLLAKVGIDPLNWIAGSATGEGITFDAADAAGDVYANLASPLVAKGVATGTARFFWLVPNVAGADGVGASAVIARIQGLAGVGSGEMRLSSAEFTASSTSNASFAVFRFP